MINEAETVPGWSWGALMVFRRNFLAWSKYYKSSVIMNFGEPLTNLLALGFGLGTYVAKMSGVPFVAFIGPGLLAVTAMNAVTFDMAFEGYDRLNENGIYQAMITAPLTVGQLIMGEYLWESVRSLLYGTVFIVVLTALGLVKSWWALMLPFPLMVTGVMFAAPALWVASRAKNHEQLFYYFTLFITPMYLFSGVFFPITHLPGIVRDVIVMTPLFHVVNIVRALVLGHFYRGLLWDGAWMLVYAGLFALMPVRILGKRLAE